MKPEEAAYRLGLMMGQQTRYEIGDLFRDEFNYPLNPYVANRILRDYFDQGIETGLGEHFLADLELWQTIEIEFTFTRKTWRPADVRREARARSEKTTH